MRHAAVALLLLFAPSFGTLSEEAVVRVADGEVARLVDQLRSPDRDVRARAARGLGGHGTEAASAVEALQRGLGDPDATVRMLCAGALAEVGAAARGAVPALSRALGDRNAGVRTYAASALGKLGALAEGAAPSLKRALSDPDAGVRKQARWSIDHVRAGVARRPEGMLTRWPEGVAHRSPIRVERRIEEAEDEADPTGSEGASHRPPRKRKPPGDRPDPPSGRDRPEPEPGSLTDLVRKLGSADRSVRLAAVRRIGWKGPRAIAAVPHLETVKEDDPDPAVRNAATTAIYRIRGTGTPRRKVGTLPEPKAPPKLEGRLYHFPLYQMPTERGPVPRDPLPTIGEFGHKHIPMLAWIDFEEVDTFRDGLRSTGSPEADLPLPELVEKHRKKLLHPYLKPFLVQTVWNDQTRFFYIHWGEFQLVLGGAWMLDRKPGRHRALFRVVTEEGLRVDDVVSFEIGPPKKKDLEDLEDWRERLRHLLEIMGKPLPDTQPERRSAEEQEREWIQELPDHYAHVAESMIETGHGTPATILKLYRQFEAAVDRALPVEDSLEPDDRHGAWWLEVGAGDIVMFGTREAYRIYRKLLRVVRPRVTDWEQKSEDNLYSAAEVRLASLAVSGAADLNAAFDHLERGYALYNRAFPEKRKAIPPRPTWGWWAEWVDPVEPEPEEIEPDEPPEEESGSEPAEEEVETAEPDEEDKEQARAIRWLSSIDDALADAQRKMAAARAELALQRIAVTKIRAKITQLQRILSKAGTRDEDLFEAAVRCWDQLWDKPLPEEPSAKMRGIVEKRIVELRDRISTILKHQDALIAKVAETYDNIVGELDAVGSKSKFEEVREATEAFRARTEKHRDVSGLHLHLASGQRLKFRTAAKRVIGGNEKLVGTARLMEAIEFLEAKDYRSALRAVRHCLASEPENKQARKLLQSLEAGYLRAIDAKVQGDAAAVRAACWKRLSTHGEPGFWGAMADLFTTGVISSVRAISGEFEAMADLSGTMQNEASRQHCGLLIMTRLREKGLTLKEIRGLTNDEFIRTMTKKFELPPGKVSRKAALRMRASLQEAFRNSDVARIASGSKLRLGVDGGSSYFDTDVFQESWGEWIGDAVNMKNVIIMLGPMSVVKAGGKAAGVSYWGVTGSGAPKTLVTAKDVFANAIRLNKLADAVGSSEVGQQFVTELMRFDKTTGLVSHMLADALVQQGIMRLGKAVGGRTGELIAEVITAYGVGDYDVAVKLLKNSGVSAAHVNAVTKQIARSLDQADGLVRAGRKLARPVNEVLDDIAQAGKLTRAARQILDDADEQLDDFAAKLTKKIEAGGASPEMLQQSHRIKSLQQAIEAARDGKPLTARVYRDIADKMDETLEAQAALLRTRKKACQEVEARLQNLTGTRKHNVTPIEEAIHDAGLEGQAASAAGDLDDAAVAGVGRRPGKDWGPEARPLAWRQKYGYGQSADQLFLEGKFEEAVKGYRKHIVTLHGMGKGDSNVAYELARKLRIAKRARAASRRIALLQSGLQDLSASAPISSKQAKAILDGPDTRLVRMKKKSYSSPYWVERKVGGQWKRVGVVKQSGKGFVDGFDHKAEVVYADFAREAGLPAPGCAEVGVNLPNKGNVKCVFVRNIEGTSLEHVGLGTQIALKKQMAKDRVLAALLGDHDRKMANYILGADGTLWSIDHGMANLNFHGRNLQSRLLRDGTKAVKGEVVSHASGNAGANHWRYRAEAILEDAHRAGGSSGNDAARLSHKLLAVENQLTFDDMAPFIAEIQSKFTAKKIRDILRKTLSGEELEAAIRVVKMRRENLKEILKPVFKAAGEVSRLWTGESPLRRAA